jgi:hypothetical protein
MAAIVDFRTIAFDALKVDASGRDIGRAIYWKLYAVENVLRVIVHSVLTGQIGPNWWSVAVSSSVQKQAQRWRSSYARRPWHGTPGAHDIYYTTLSDLNEIIRANSHLFLPIITDIDQWVARIEQIRLPRNIVGHMNWPSRTDRQRIDVFYSDLHALANHLVSSGLTLAIP